MLTSHPPALQGQMRELGFRGWCNPGAESMGSGAQRTWVSTTHSCGTRHLFPRLQNGDIRGTYLLGLLCWIKLCKCIYE